MPPIKPSNNTSISPYIRGASCGGIQVISTVRYFHTSPFETLVYGDMVHRKIPLILTLNLAGLFYLSLPWHYPHKRSPRLKSKAIVWLLRLEYLLRLLEHSAHVVRPILNKTMTNQDIKHLYTKCMKGRNKCTSRSLNMTNSSSHNSSV
jgi:hypothetical protein